MPTRRTVLTAAAGAAAVPFFASPAEAAPKVTRTLASGLDIPWGLAFLPSGDALVTERNNGRVHRVRRTGGRTLVGDIAQAVQFGEGGLLGAAVAPTFAQDRWVYFYLTTASDNRVIRKKYVKGALGPTEVLLDGIERTSGGSTNHHGGRLAFGPTGHLFIATGDAGDRDRAQDENSLNGKILRLNADGSVPADNPISGNPLWTLGHRNVQGLAWTAGGKMFATELGQNTRDELNVIRKGRNYGWPDVEGGDGPGPYADPFVVWRPTSTCSPSGLAIAKGRAWVGALAGESLYSVVLAGPKARTIRRHFNGTYGRIRTVAKAPDGSLWIATANGGNDKVLRVTV